MIRLTQVAALDQLQDRIEEQLTDLLTTALDNLPKARRFDEVLEAVRLRTAHRLYTREGVEAALAPVFGAIALAFVEAGTTAAAAQPRLTKAADIYFDPTSEETQSYVEEAAAAILLALMLDAEEAIVTTMRRGLTRNWTERKIAHALRQNLGLTPKMVAAVENYRASLEGNSRMALAPRLRDPRGDGPVARAVDTGAPLPQRQIDSLVSRYASRMRAHRARLIARTVTTRIINQAQKALMDAQVRRGLVDAASIRRYWHTRRDERVRHSHRLIPGMNERGVGPDEPFQTPLGPLRYPGDPLGIASNVLNCRCRVRYGVVEEQA